MRAPFRKGLRDPEQRRALQILAGIPFSASEAMMFTNDFEHRTLARLIRIGLATIQRESISPGSESVGRVRITEAGRRALEGY
jgi:hypothetical protein